MPPFGVRRRADADLLVLLGFVVLLELGFMLPALWVVAACLAVAWLVGFPAARRGRRWYRWR